MPTQYGPAETKSVADYGQCLIYTECTWKSKCKEYKLCIGKMLSSLNPLDRKKADELIDRVLPVGSSEDGETVFENVTYNDPVNHPRHYTSHPSGVECIQITRWMNFNLGNALKYIWRAGEKGDAVQDLRKAQWYLEDEIRRIEVQNPGGDSKD